jgi:hypothetical protein
MTKESTGHPIAARLNPLSKIQNQGDANTPLTKKN